MGSFTRGRKIHVLWNIHFGFVEAIIQTPEPTPNTCPKDFIPYGKGCYLIIRSARDWGSSRDYCTQQNARLVSITSPYEAGFVYSLMNLDNINSDIWIGLSDYFVSASLSFNIYPSVSKIVMVIYMQKFGHCALLCTIIARPMVLYFYASLLQFGNTCFQIFKFVWSSKKICSYDSIWYADF